MGKIRFSIPGSLPGVQEKIFYLRVKSQIFLYDMQENRVSAKWLSGGVLDSRSRMRNLSLIGGTVLCMTFHLPLSPCITENC